MAAKRSLRRALSYTKLSSHPLSEHFVSARSILAAAGLYSPVDWIVVLGLALYLIVDVNN